jgi:zinc transport system substrate-binding protein
VFVPPGSSAETYEPTPLQMQDVANSVLYFRIGYLEFETTLIRNIQAQITVNFVNTADGN